MTERRLRGAYAGRMHRVEEYERRAREAEEAACGMTGYFRDQFLDVAHQWRLLASQARGLAAREPCTVEAGEGDSLAG